MRLAKFVFCLAAVVGLAACETPPGPDKTIDRGLDRKPLEQLKAGIWVDPQGCDHWIVDDGAEGYMSARLDPAGRPVCSGVLPPGHAGAGFRDGNRTRNAR